MISFIKDKKLNINMDKTLLKAIMNSKSSGFFQGMIFNELYDMSMTKDEDILDFVEFALLVRRILIEEKPNLNDYEQGAIAGMFTKALNSRGKRSDEDIRDAIKFNDKIKDVINKAVIEEIMQF